MFLISESEAKAIRLALKEQGEFFAAIKLRRHFPDINSLVTARECVRRLAGAGVQPDDLVRSTEIRTVERRAAKRCAPRTRPDQA